MHAAGELQLQLRTVARQRRKRVPKVQPEQSFIQMQNSAAQRSRSTVESLKRFAPLRQQTAATVRRPMSTSTQTEQKIYSVITRNVNSLDPVTLQIDPLTNIDYSFLSLQNPLNKIGASIRHANVDRSRVQQVNFARPFSRLCSSLFTRSAWGHFRSLFYFSLRYLLAKRREQRASEKINKFRLTGPFQRRKSFTSANYFAFAEIKRRMDGGEGDRDKRGPKSSRKLMGKYSSHFFKATRGDWKRDRDSNRIAHTARQKCCRKSMLQQNKFI